MKYTDEEKKIIDEVKKYLRELRLINIEKFSLTFEIEDIPSPQSINTVMSILELFKIQRRTNHF